MDRSYEVLASDRGAPIKMWTRGVKVEDGARAQLRKTAEMPFIFRHLAVMPDVHVGIGSTVGSVIPTKNAIIPAAVGVDIGCGMMAARTTLTAKDLPDTLAPLRSAIEAAVPHGRTAGRDQRDKGSWQNPPKAVEDVWAGMRPGFEAIVEKHPAIAKSNNLSHLGTLGTGNHFIEVCLDEADRVWFMLHSGSRGVGNRIGSYFIGLAKKDMTRWFINLPDEDLAYFPEGTDHFDDYVAAVEWAQAFAAANRTVMMANTLAAARLTLPVPFEATAEAVDCHHNYVAREYHFGESIFITRKGAVRAAKGTMGIIPGSMGVRSYIVRGLGNPESFCSCSHGAGRVMSRTAARKAISLEEHQAALAHVECRKDEAVLDETPAAYKPIDDVMAAQKDLVEVVHTLRQVVCVKG
ncbi:RtcB family protein [Algihabitans albus]|uniref:RtcB family protein n=1 Tax=Algihabitans albus TaxID=2164067 RepID=UPI0035CF7D60